MTIRQFALLQNFLVIVEAADACGAEWYIVEQDMPSLGYDALEFIVALAVADDFCYFLSYGVGGVETWQIHVAVQICCCWAWMYGVGTSGCSSRTFCE